MAPVCDPKIAVVGCGPWGKNLACTFAQLGALHTLVDTDAARAREIAKHLSEQAHGDPVVSTWEDAVHNVAIDAVAIATPASQHADMAIAALEAGKHVYIEKPFALSVEDGQRVICAASRAGKVMMVGHLFHYHPAFVALSEMVRQGRLGRIQHIHARRLGFGRVREEENAFWSLGPHDVSMILALAGEMPIRVTARGFHHLRPNVADIASADIFFPSGIQADILVSWLHPQKERKLVVIGDIATAVFDDCEPWSSKLCVFRNYVEVDGGPKTIHNGRDAVMLDEEAPLVQECRHFIGCVKHGLQPNTGGEEASNVVQVLVWVEEQIQRNVFAHLTDRHHVSMLAEGRPDQENDRLVNATLRHFDDINGGGSSVVSDKYNSSSPIPLIDLSSQKSRLRLQLDSRLTRVLDHSKFVLGPEVQELEKRLCQYAGVAHAITCGSGTAALTMALLALGMKPGDAVLVPDLSFVATVEPIALLGGIPIFVDVEPETLTIDASLLHAGVAMATRVGRRAVGVIAVDLYGHPADYDALHEAAAALSLWVIGDAAQSFGAKSNGRHVGSLARVTTTSFFPSKPLGCYGDGGAVFTDDSSLAKVLASLRQHGLDASKSMSLRVGLNSRLDTIQAAVLLCKLDVVEEEMEARGRVADRYNELLDGLVTLPQVRNGTRCAWAAYTVRTGARQSVKRHLDSRSIASAVYYPVPFHKHPAYQHFPIIEGSCPVATAASEEVLSLPMNPYLEPGTQMRVTNALRHGLD